ncbi:MAG: signal peptide peptidase SppA [Planctomycetes bacterium]|nr:signal peptide peptidase SppA [Planctomycetota bacterium]
MNDSNTFANSPSQRGGCLRVAKYLLVIGSFLLNIAFCIIISVFKSSDSEELPETRLWGDDDIKDKIAVIRIDGVLMEGVTRHYLQQIEQAANDKRVKAIVVRIDSPGGTITASEEIHRALTQLRDGKLLKYPESKPKKLVVSMGAIAASGGYYIAMPAERIFAEQTTITGSIGVYASLPNVAKFINQHGVHFELIKAGGIKASGSPFHELTPQERQPWQEMVDSSYDHFLGIVVGGRPALTKVMLRDDVLIREQIAVRNDKGDIAKDWMGQPQMVEYVRRRADGGTFTATEALRYGLIDEIGTLEAAVAAVAASEKLSKYKVVAYEKPPSLIRSLLGMQMRSSGFEPGRLANATAPRLWYLAPQADLSGILTGMANP